MKCDVCGRELMMPNGTALLGADVIINSRWSDNPALHEFAEKQIAPYELNRRYRICFACLLRALGVPEPKE